MPMPGIAPGSPPYQGGALLLSYEGELEEELVGEGVAPPPPRCERGVVTVGPTDRLPPGGVAPPAPACRAGVMAVSPRERDRAGGVRTRDLWSPRPARYW